MSAALPPVTPESGIISAPWLAGPRDGTGNAVVVSFTDFRAGSDKDVSEIFQAGLKLGENWPVMEGAVGVWLWGKPADRRGGSVSVWESRTDLGRFIRWPVHVAIMDAWRERIEVCSITWEDDRFDPAAAWRRAEAHMRQPRHMPDPSLGDRP